MCEGVNSYASNRMGDIMYLCVRDGSIYARHRAGTIIMYSCVKVSSASRRMDTTMYPGGRGMSAAILVTGLVLS